MMSSGCLLPTCVVSYADPDPQIDGCSLLAPERLWPCSWTVSLTVPVAQLWIPLKSSWDPPIWSHLWRLPGDHYEEESSWTASKIESKLVCKSIKLTQKYSEAQRVHCLLQCELHLSISLTVKGCNVHIFILFSHSCPLPTMHWCLEEWIPPFPSNSDIICIKY